MLKEIQAAKLSEERKDHNGPSIRGVVYKRDGGRSGGTPDTQLYETSIETAIMDHFIQKRGHRLSVPPHYTLAKHQLMVMSNCD